MSRSETRARATGTGLAVAVAAVALSGLGWVAGYPELLAVGLSCAALLLAALVAVARLPGVEVERSLGSRRIVAGERADLTLTVRNRGRLRSPVLLATDQVAGQVVAVRVPSLGPGRSWTRTTTLPPQPRGVHRIGPLEVERADPLRLLRRRLRRGGSEQLTVYPTVHPYSWPLHGAQRERSTGAHMFGDIGFTNLREYVPGDDLRQIHWPSSARLSTLLVRERMSPDEPRLALVLDTSRAGYGGAADPDEAFEDAVRVVASLAAAAQRLGRPVTVRCTDGRVAAAGGRRSGLGPVLDLLASVGTGTDDPGLDVLGRLASGREDDLLVIVGSRLPPLRLLTQVRHRYSNALLVGIGMPETATGPVPPGMGLVRASTSAELVRGPARR